MKKIGRVRRFFMSWNELESYIKNNLNNDGKLIELETKSKYQENIIDELKKDKLNNQEKFDVIGKQLYSVTDENKQLKVKLEQEKNNADKNNKQITEKSKDIENLKEKIREAQHNLENTQKSIDNKLKPLERIETMFFGNAGNKGKGELAERQLKTILEKSGLDKDYWVENLTIGSKSVEFAIRSGLEEKWIPVDSKAYEPNQTESGEYIIDTAYKTKIKSAAKKIKEYLSKKNTADYGLLVLHSDSIYSQLYGMFPDLFNETIKEYKVYICSPSSFIQFSWSISHLLEIYKKVHNDEKIYDEMIDTLTRIGKFSVSLLRAHDSLNTAINTHYPTIEKKGNELIEKLHTSGKVKELKKIGE